ncbi:MAG: hypothetical protein AB7U20_12520 [Planctomycetaceae bacterium]
MSIVLTSPIARSVFIGGVLFGLGVPAGKASAEERTLRPSEAPLWRAVPQDVAPAGDADASAPLTLPPSETTQKLVLVGAEIDAEAEEPRVSQLEKGSSSRRHRQAAVDDLPQQNLTPQQRQVVVDVLDSTSVFRRLPAFRCELDPRVHDYFIRYPDVAVSIWRAMAISCLEMTQTNPRQYEIDTRDGTTGVVTVLHQTRESCLVHCEGLFKSPYLKDAIHAKSLMHLKTKFTADRDGRIYATHQADLFVSFPSQKVGTIAKLISPVSNAIIDRNFQEISLFIHVMWLAMTKQPGWVEQIAGRLEGVPPGRSEELITLTAEVYVTAQTNLRKRTGLPVSLETIRPPSGNPLRSAGTAPIDVTR